MRLADWATSAEEQRESAAEAQAAVASGTMLDTRLSLIARRVDVGRYRIGLEVRHRRIGGGSRCRCAIAPSRVEPIRVDIGRQDDGHAIVNQRYVAHCIARQDGEAQDRLAVLRRPLGPQPGEVE